MAKLNRHRELLKQAGQRATPARLAILDALAASLVPLGPKEIAAKLKVKPDPVTVYRVLESLVRIGAVRRVDLRHDHADYELTDRGDHHHLVCLSCGRIEDFEGCGGDELAKKALKRSKHFASVSEHAVELFGRCKSCAKKHG
jgi:Fur family ferric uptake transcriptional regulator